MKHRSLFFALAWLFLSMAAGCFQEEPPIPVDLSNRVPVSAPVKTRTLTYAYLPQYSHSVSYRRHHGIVMFFGKANRDRHSAGFPGHL